MTCFVISSSIFRRPIFQKISEFLRESPRSSFFLAVIVLPAGLDLSGRIETEQENDQSEDDRDCAHGLFTCRKSLRQRWRVARPATDSIRRTRRKRPSLSLSRSY